MPVNDEIPESRIMLTYRTTVDGEPRDVDLPFRLLVLGDLSNGSSKDRRERQVEITTTDADGKEVKSTVAQKDALDARSFRTLDGKNLRDVMRDMDIKLTLNVRNRIDVNDPLDKRAAIPVKLTIDSMEAFTPKSIAEHVPQLKAMLVLKNLLKEVQANLDNRREFRELLRLINKMEPSARGTQIKALLDKIDAAGFKDSHGNFSVPRRGLNADNPANNNATPPVTQ
jgi:type VI secretion system protein ImpB